MRKSHLFVAVGAAVVLCGCPSTPITGPKPVIPAPLEDPSPAENTLAAPEIVTAPEHKVEVPVFEPMTGVKSSGGVDQAPKQKKNKAAVAGGVYVVQSGDTPERIARKLGVRLSAFMAANNLDQQSARRLQIGQKLIIPGKGAKFARVKKSKKSTNAVAPAAAVDADGKYTVQSGDTPERIARKQRVRLAELLKANNLDQQSARRLQIGQKLIIPGKAPVQEVKSTDLDVVQQPVSAVGSTDAVSAETVVQPTVDVPASTDTAAPQPPVDAAAVETAAPTAATDADSEIQLIEIEEDITVAALSSKLNVPADVLSQKNSGKTEFKKGELIFVPKK